MDSQLKGAFFFVLTNMKQPFIIFWLVLTSFLVITYGLSYLFISEDTTVMYDLSFPIYIFGAVFGFVAVKNCIPYLIKMGSTRFNIFITAGLAFFGLTLLNAILSNTIYFAINKMFRTTNEAMFTIETGENAYSFSHIADLVTESTWYSRIIIDTSIAFFLLACFFILGLIFYRFGYIGGFSVLGILMATLMLSIAKGWVFDYLFESFTDFHFVFFYQLLLIGIVIYLMSYVFMRRITI